MNDVADALDAEQAQLWQQYLSAEALGYRKSTLAALRDFVQSLQAGSEKQKRSFTEAFCRQMADAREKLPLREPLFAGVIGPYLVTAYQKGEEDVEGWLLYFCPYFRNMPPSQKLIDVPSLPPPMELLAQAYQRDPANILTQDALIQYYANLFAYAVHEVPAGVLYGTDGATAAECQEWLDNLALFREVVQKRGITENYETALRYWEFHFRGYADYLMHREQYRNYEEYISRHWQE